MIKIIFYSTDGIGLGHIMRGINIAKELKKIIKCEILFVTNTPFIDIFEREGFCFERGTTDPYELYNGNISPDDYKRVNEEFLLSVIKKNYPHIIVFDLIVVPSVIAYAKKNNIFLVYILRELYNWHYLLSYKDYLPSFDLVLLACIPDPVLISKFKSIGFNKNKIFYTGNIFREPDQNKIDSLKLKYKKKDKELLITITAGGGGFSKETKNFFSIVGVIAKKIGSELRKRKGNFINIRWLLIKGPLFQEDINLPDNIEVHDYEMDLPELFFISDLVVSAGGYNSVNEIIASKTPALIYPFPTRIDSQITRISAYTSMGFIQLFDIWNHRELMNLFSKMFNSDCLNKMRESYNTYTHKNGKRLAAGVILKEFLKYS